MLRWLLSRSVRQAVDLCRQARKILQAQQDLIDQAARDAVEAAIGEVRAAVASGESLETLTARMSDLEKIANTNLKPYPDAAWRENVEVLLVTGAVVLALRSFFFQPMAIPSGSAQPTLWGIHHENLKGRAGGQVPGRLQRIFEFWWSGTHYFHQIAKADGELTIGEPRTIFPFVKRQTLRIGGVQHDLWFVPDDVARRAGLWNGQVFHRGEEILKLKVVSGDHLFVNRMTYNFRHPARGEIIVFESRGIPRLIPDTHYIKRLVAVGGDRVRVGDDRHLIINGQRLDASTPFFENVYGFDPNQPPEPDCYSGHVNRHVASRHGLGNIAALFPDEKAEITVPKNQFLAMGDNTMNSHDGRDWGSFPREKVVGKAGFVFWPITARFGWGYR
jgi:signal peptidase I